MGNQRSIRFSARRGQLGIRRRCASAGGADTRTTQRHSFDNLPICFAACHSQQSPVLSTLAQKRSRRLSLIADHLTHGNHTANSPDMNIFRGRRRNREMFRHDHTGSVDTHSSVVQSFTGMPASRATLMQCLVPRLFPSGNARTKSAPESTIC